MYNIHVHGVIVSTPNKDRTLFPGWGAVPRWRPAGARRSPWLVRLKHCSARWRLRTHSSCLWKLPRRAGRVLGFLGLKMEYPPKNWWIWWFGHHLLCSKWHFDLVCGPFSVFQNEEGRLSWPFDGIICVVFHSFLPPFLFSPRFILVFLPFPLIFHGIFHGGSPAHLLQRTCAWRRHPWRSC